MNYENYSLFQILVKEVDYLRVSGLAEVLYTSAKFILGALNALKGGLNGKTPISVTNQYVSPLPHAV